MSRLHQFDASRLHVFKHSRLHVRNGGRAPCDALRCRAVYPLNGIDPFPAYTHGVHTISYGDAADVDDPVALAFLASVGYATGVAYIFDLFTPSSISPNEGGWGIGTWGDGNSTTRYRKADYAAETFFLDSDIGPGNYGGLYAWTFQRLIHGTAWTTGMPVFVFNAQGVDYERSGTVTAESTLVTDGATGLWSIAQNGTVTSSGNFNSWYQTFNFGSNRPWWPTNGFLRFVLETVGASMTITITATTAELEVLIPEAAMQDVCSTNDPIGDFTITSSITLSEPASAPDLVPFALDLLNLFDITGNPFDNDYSAYSLGGDNKLHRNNSYVAYYEGPTPGVAIATKMRNEPWPFGTVVTNTERVYFGGIYGAPDWAGGGYSYARGACTLAKSWVGTNGLASCLYSQQFLLPVVMTDAIGTNSDPGHLDTITDDCDSPFPQSSGVSRVNPDTPDDIIYTWGVATIYRQCKNEPCCPVTLTLATPVHQHSYPANVFFEATVRATGHTVDKVEFLYRTIGAFQLAGEDATAPYTYTWSPTAGNYDVIARVTYDTTLTHETFPIRITVT